MTFVYWVDACPRSPTRRGRRTPRRPPLHAGRPGPLILLLALNTGRTTEAIVGVERPHLPEWRARGW